MDDQIATKICPECATTFQHRLQYESKRAYCTKKCRLKAWRRERRAKFPEKVRAEEMAAYLRNREKRISKMRAYYETHREQEKPKHRQWHAENRDEQNAKRRQWYANHQEYSKMKTAANEQHERLEQPWKKLIRTAEQRARKKGVPFELTYAWGEEHWTGHCKLTGIKFFLGQRGNGPKSLSPSIDRIRPELGYVPSNCRFVIWAVNAFKGESTDEEMFRIAVSLLSFRKSPL